MGTPVRSRNRNGQHPRVRLQEAGTRLFYNKGFHATSVRDITEACGLTPGALYNHFGSKEELLYSIIMDGHAALDRLLDAVRTDAPAPERLHGLIEAFVLHHTRYRKEAVVGDEWRALGEEHRDEVRRLRLGIRARVQDVIRDGAATGAFELPKVPNGDPVRMAATAALDMSFRVAGWFSPDGPVSDTAFASFYADLVLRSISKVR
ncbi:TetR family transcriptional regulator [Amycolatopsis deserti]|uniref:TetR family transcriptional regulator n=1 Tax=Amycolatopsis deserti TaxID=185696 RepID=A0ABQ3IAF7_9PSEU|nr:TetR/AcrR family transcriptional regulator [Amycolatopsis deserti]GHE75630.1 TetR family transcriptional regulator [Amycolatopsis deserti]